MKTFGSNKLLTKYFGPQKVTNEFSIVDSLIEHTRIDEEELNLLHDMVRYLCQHKNEVVPHLYEKIRKINDNSRAIFERTAEEIIQAQFDQQKQYDLLRLFQRIEYISTDIILCAKRILILCKLDTELPDHLTLEILTLTKAVEAIHLEFKASLHIYLKDKKKLLSYISAIEKMEADIQEQQAVCLEQLYQLGNKGVIRLGTLRALESVSEHIDDTGAAIKEAATSLEWLLIY